MAAIAFLLPYPAAVRPTGVGAPRAKAYFYAPGTTTLRAVYTSAALTTQLSNPVVADGAGRFPSIYLDNALTYRLVIDDKDDANLFEQDPYTPGEIVAASVAVGTVTTGAAGSSASVTNSGSSAAAVLDFTIPRGATGSPGAGSGTVTAVSVATANGVSGSVATSTTTPAITLTLGSITPSSTTVSGAITSTSATAGIGYATGAGGAITQLTNKSTAVTLNKVSGQITMNNASLASASGVAFTLNNSTIAATDVIVVNIGSGGAGSTYSVMVTAVAAGSCRIQLRNDTGGALAETLVLNFAVIKAVIA